jgi:hypothetical protein
MAGFDEFRGCMEARGTQFGQVTRDIANKAFNGASDTALAFIKAAVSWWDGLDPQVRRAVGFGLTVGGAAGAIIFARLATVLIDAAGLELLAGAGAEVAAGWRQLSWGWQWVPSWRPAPCASLSKFLLNLSTGGDSRYGWFWRTESNILADADQAGGELRMKLRSGNPLVGRLGGEVGH